MVELKSVQCGHPECGCMEDKRERSPVGRGVISPHSLKAGISALMCQIKVVVGQYEDGRRIVMEDFESLQEYYETVEHLLKETGL